MGCRIIHGKQDGHEQDAAVFYCSTTMMAFGPVMGSLEEAEKFLTVLPDDPRKYQEVELIDRYLQFVNSWVCECGTVRDPEDEAYQIAKDFCTCPNNGEGDCPYCEALSIANDWEPEPGERWECRYCSKKKSGASSTGNSVRIPKAG